MAGAYYEIVVDDRHATLWWYDEYDGGRESAVEGTLVSLWDRCQPSSRSVDSALRARYCSQQFDAEERDDRAEEAVPAPARDTESASKQWEGHNEGYAPSLRRADFAHRQAEAADSTSGVGRDSDQIESMSGAAVSTLGAYRASIS